MALTASKQRRVVAFGASTRRNYDCDPSVIIFEGAIIGLNKSSGFSRPFVIGDVFLGIAMHDYTNPSASASIDKPLSVEFDQIETFYQTIGNGDVGKNIYPSDDSVITLSVPGAMPQSQLMGQIMERIDASSFTAKLSGPDSYS